MGRVVGLQTSRCMLHIRVQEVFHACQCQVPCSIILLQGYGLTYVLMFARIRLGLHKHAKEGLACLLESCTQREYERVSGFA